MKGLLGRYPRVRLVKSRFQYDDDFGKWVIYYAWTFMSNPFALEVNASHKEALANAVDVAWVAKRVREITASNNCRN